MAMEKLGAPRVFTVQLLLVYRYLFVLTTETIRMIRAHSLRSFKQKGRISFPAFSQILGNLLIRTINRAQRIHLAMLSRAFTGEVKTVRQFSFGSEEFLFLAGFTVLFIFLRLIDITTILGQLVLEMGINP